AWKARVHVPAGVPGIFSGGESHRKASQSVARQPPSVSDQFIESGVQLRRIHRLSKRFFVMFPKPNDRLRPGGPVSRVATGVFPQYFPCPLGKITGKRAVQSNEPMLHELFSHAGVLTAAAPVSI